MYSEDTGFQALEVRESPTYGRMLFLDGDLQLATADEFMYHEPLVHPACVLCGGPRKVLILGGGDGAAAREVLKWRCVERLVVVEIDRRVAAVTQSLLPEVHRGAFRDSKVEVVEGDGLQYLRDHGTAWDVILADVTGRESRLAGPFFEESAIGLISQRLSSGGVFAQQIGSTGIDNCNSFIQSLAVLRRRFPVVMPIQSFPASFGEPWGFAMATERAPESCRIEADSVDALLRRATSGDFAMFDGVALCGMLALPRHLRGEWNASEVSR